MTLPLPGHSSSRDLRDFANDGDFFPDEDEQEVCMCSDKLCPDFPFAESLKARMGRREARGAYARQRARDEALARDRLYGARSGMVEAAPVRPPVDGENGR